MTSPFLHLDNSFCTLRAGSREQEMIFLLLRGITPLKLSIFSAV
jgi:hypothetical protein